MKPYFQTAVELMDLDQKAASEGRKVDEVPPHVLLLSKKSSKVSGKEESKTPVATGIAPTLSNTSNKSATNVDTSSIKSLNMANLIAIAEAKAQSGPWREELSSEESKLCKQLKTDDEKYFKRNFQVFFQIANELKITRDQQSGEQGARITNSLEIPLIDNDREVLMAI